MKCKFHQKVISYSYYEPNLPDPYHHHYFNGIRKNLHDIKNKFGAEWSMRLYIQMSTISATQRKYLCNLACRYQDEFEICDVEINPRFGNISHIYPLNWRFFTALDPQVDVTFFSWFGFTNHSSWTRSCKAIPQFWISFYVRSPSS